MPQDFDSPESPFIRITRSNTGIANDRASFASDVAPTRPARSSSKKRVAVLEEPEELDVMEEAEDAPEAQPARAQRRARGTRPMPRRLSEEQSEEKAKAPKPAKTKKEQKAEADQIALDLKSPKKKPDNVVRQRQVLGLIFITFAILVT